MRETAIVHTSCPLDSLSISFISVHFSFFSSDLPDDPRAVWKEEAIENYVLSAVHNCTIGRVSLSLSIAFIFRVILSFYKLFIFQLASFLKFTCICSLISLIWTPLGQIKERGVLNSGIFKYINVLLGTDESVMFNSEVSL